MFGGTLVVSRYTNLLPEIKEDLEELGFFNVNTTSHGKDALNLKINELKPSLVIIDTSFWYSATPFMAGELLKLFPNLNMVAVSFCEYPATLAMSLLSLGAKSYANRLDGRKEFNKGLVSIKDGKRYISPSVLREIEDKGELPETKFNISLAEFTVLQLICNCMDTPKIADIMNISTRTVETYKQRIKNILHCHSEQEILRTAIQLKYVREDELIFYPKDKHKKIKKKVLKIKTWK